MSTQSAEAKHTPGPWSRRGTHIHYQANPGGYRFDIAEVFRDVGAAKADANAALIAASPELLDACKDLVLHFPSTNDPSDKLALAQAKAAIAIAQAI